MDYGQARARIKYAAKSALSSKWLSGSLLIGFLIIISTFCSKFIVFYEPATPVDFEQFVSMENIERIRLFIDTLIPDTITLAFLFRSAIVILLYLLLIPPFEQGTRQYFCEVLHAHNPKLSVAFSWYADLGKVFGAIGLYIYIFLLSVLWTVLFLAVPMVAIAVSYVAGLPLLYLLGSLLLIISLFFLALKLLSYSPAYYIHAANPQIGILGAVRTSVKITRGRLFEYLVFELSFILWHIFVSLSYGFGELIFYPYYYTASTAFVEYLALSLQAQVEPVPEKTE